jgi:2-dehydropantoate 2-reductase
MRTEQAEMAIDRVCVIGGGAIGSLTAAHLSRVAEVWVLTRRPEHAQALRSGLRISGKSEFIAEVHGTDDPAELPPFDLGVFATKTIHLERSAAVLEGHSPEAVMMTMQNGLGAEEVVRAHGGWPLISAVTFMSGIRHSDSHIEYELDTQTWMGPYAGTSTPFDVALEVGSMFVDSGLHAEVMSDLLPAQWSKLIFNAAVNGVAALTGLPHVPEYADREELTGLGHLVAGLIDEGKAVASAAGIALHADPWEMNCLAVAMGQTDSGEYAHLPSMLEDVIARRPTEVDAISGAVVREGLRLGVETPLNAAVHRLIKAKERSWQRLEASLTEAVGR